MIPLEGIVPFALALDLILGDPRSLPHPVNGIAFAARFFEERCRNLLNSPRAAGISTLLLTLLVTGLLPFVLLSLAAGIHPMFELFLAIIFIYTTLSLKGLADHALAVYHPLKRGNLEEARVKVGYLVGRETEKLDEPGVIRATVESVSENLVDGVTAPLFYAFLGGPPGAFLYKAINTMDSLFGYKSEKYLHFGWAPARLDDLANYIPARLTAPLVALAAGLLGLDGKNSFKILGRDGNRHPSPNSGLTEAAVAGALGIRLGGPSRYGGELSMKPYLGDARRDVEKEDILRAVRLLYLSSFLVLFLFMALIAFIGTLL